MKVIGKTFPGSMGTPVIDVQIAADDVPEDGPSTPTLPGYTGPGFYWARRTDGRGNCGSWELVQIEDRPMLTLRYLGSEWDDRLDAVEDQYTELRRIEEPKG